MTDQDLRAQIEAELKGTGCSASEPYALQVHGDSMEPEFEHGCIIVIDPDGVAHHECYVVAQLEGGYSLRQLVIEDERYIVQPLNEAYMHERQEVDLRDIKGVVIQQAGATGRRKDRKHYR